METELIEKLNSSNAHRESRMGVCDFVINNNLVDALIQISFDVNDVNHFKAFWALEFVCEKNLDLFTPYIARFCEILPTVRNNSTVRSGTKICMFLAINNHRKAGINISEKEELQLIESSIDRLIQDEKVASKVYAMKTLFIFGKKYDWIFKQIKPIISQDACEHSYAYQANARNILKKI
jgi:hypothetical protein